MNELFRSLHRKCSAILENTEYDRDEKLINICMLLKENVEHYDWVGFYFVDPEKDKTLTLGPYVGDPTEHVNIQFGVGICGQTAETKKVFLVQDVSQVTNYLSCSPQVKSEIVVPIFKDGGFVGELDIDSHITGPFTEEDEEFLDLICKDISDIL